MIQFELKHLNFFVTGALIDYFKSTNQKIDDDRFDYYRKECIEVVFQHLTKNKPLDDSCSDFQCTIALEAKKVFKTQLPHAGEGEKQTINGSSIWSHQAGDESWNLPLVPPILKEMTQMRVGDFLVYANGSGELFVQPTDRTGSKTTSQPFRCQSWQSGLKIAAQHIDIVPYGGSTGILLSN